MMLQRADLFVKSPVRSVMTREFSRAVAMGATQDTDRGLKNIATWGSKRENAVRIDREDWYKPVRTDYPRPKSPRRQKRRRN